MSIKVGEIAFGINLITDKIEIVDGTDYDAEGVIIGQSINVFVKSLKSPKGEVLSENPINSGTPDLTYLYGDSGTVLFDLPKFLTGEVQTGNYVVDFEAVVGADNYLFQGSFSYLGFTEPTPILTIVADTITPLFSVTDETDYSQELYSDLLPFNNSTRTITIDFPKDGEPNLVSTNASVETSRFFTGTQTVNLARTLTYFVSQFDFYIKYQLNFEVDEVVVHLQDLCSLSNIVAELYTKLQSARKYNNNPTQQLNDWREATNLLVMIREALSCGYKDELSEYAEQIRLLAKKCNCNCVEAEDGILVEGLSVYDNNDLTIGYATSDSGLNYSTQPFDNYTHIAFLTHNKKHTPVVDDFDGLWHERPTGGGNANLERDVTNTLGADFGGIKKDEVIPEGSTPTEILAKLIEVTQEPTLIAPTFSLSRSTDYLQIVGDTVTFDLTFTFNRGQILGKLVNNIWQPNTEQNKRAGEATRYTIDGTIQEVASVANAHILEVTKTFVGKGVETYSASTTYGIGAQPTNSVGGNFDSPLAGGQGNASVTIEKVYPLFASTAVINVATQQALISMITGNNIELTLVAESGGNKQFFEIPTTWLTARTITKVEFYNTLTQTFDPTNQLSTFTQTVYNKTIEGNSISYTKFTNNGVDRGLTIIKLIF